MLNVKDEWKQERMSRPKGSLVPRPFCYAHAHNRRVWEPDYPVPEGRKECPTPHYSVERHLNLNGCDNSLIWTYSEVGRKCCFYSQRATLHALHSRVIPYAYSTGNNSKRVTRCFFQFTTVEQEREHENKRLGKRQALYTRL